MVESALYFVIGFLCATMLAILATPAVSRRAMRLANARARLQAPLSESQARAERDALRAIHAVEIVKLEKKVTSADWDRALAKTEQARQVLRMAKLEEAAAELGDEISDRDRRIDAFDLARRALEAESGAKDVALWDLTGQRDLLQKRLETARSTIAALEAQSDESRMRIAILATKVSALEFEMTDLRAGKSPFGGESLQGLEDRLRRSEQAREAQTLELGRQMRLAAEREAALASARSARDALAQKLENSERLSVASASRTQALGSSTPDGAGAPANRAADLPQSAADQDAMQRRLEEALASVESLTKGDAALRLAIAKLGRDIVRARQPQDDEPHVEAQIVNFARREPMS